MQSVDALSYNFPVKNVASHKPKTAKTVAARGPKTGWYFGFSVNEYNYRDRPFTKHKTREAAQRAHYTPFVTGESPVSHDLEATIIHGVEEFVAWAKECDYDIDWTEQRIRYRGK